MTAGRALHVLYSALDLNDFAAAETALGGMVDGRRALRKRRRVASPGSATLHISQVFPKRSTRVFFAEESAPLKLGDHKVNEFLKASGTQGMCNHKPVAAAGFEPILHFVGYRLRSAYKSRR